MVLFNQALETRDYARFWDAARKYMREKYCEDDGVVDGVWYTLPSRARDFGVCGACYAGILEPLGLSRFWVRKMDVPPGKKVLCCFNINHPRFFKFLPLIGQMDFTLDPKPLDEYALVYASIPICPRDEDKPNLRWYGWRDCTICPECYQEFARQGPLANLMEYHDIQVAENSICDMYSPRMRNLYTECGRANPPDLQKLLQYSAQRAQVYTETVPQIRMMLFQARMQLQQQKMLNTMSSHYTMMGHMDQITYGTHHSYSAPGIGYGFANANLLQGAAYGQQAAGIMSNLVSGGSTMAVQQLEQRWRAVE
ncbi:hypothetical protein NPX13_g10614 [Xylaria arbuscula]|uniref:Integral membrane protein n=1 Tax=Xylaria arbuscula TaxID=114810 RepID=A0A9W8N4E5_9PEZI|nr:hypothetical protein NPX13_g10614 [Xylaria arbuscula]